MVDRNRNEFGSARHRYELSAPVTQAALEAIESGNGYSFPPVLRDFWLHAGARGAGPNYGVLGPGEVRPFRPTEPMTAVAGAPASRARSDGAVEHPRAGLARG